MKYDFGGYATKNDLQCADGRIIRHGAFADNDGMRVPLVWQHRHDSVENVLGHALLENRDDGVYAYCCTNDTEAGQHAKRIVEHGDVCALSIFANHLKQNGSEVIHGNIREVSLVLAGANPGAMIDNLQFAHGDDIDIIDDEADIYCNAPIEHADIKGSRGSVAAKPALDSIALEHADEEPEDSDSDSDKTVKEVFDSIPEDKLEAIYSIIGAAVGEGEPTDDAEEVFNSLTEEQKTAVYVVVGSAVDSSDSDDDDEDSDEAEHSDLEGEIMKHNVFDANGEHSGDVLTHADVQAIFDDARTSGNGSLKDAMLAHGITDIEVLFPEAQNITNTPELISRDMEWVSAVLNATRKTPFSRVKSTAANITADEARARGYIKGRKKIEEQISALKRTTDPQTVYKLQKLDRDDIIDITDFDTVAWIKQEMRVMLNEEIARAILVGDGRPVGAEDKITEDHIRPVWTDNDVYTVHHTVDSSLEGTARAKAFIEKCIRARKDYKGSGNPTMYVGMDLLTDMRLIRDDLGYRLYKNDQELADELRVSKIVPIELFDGLARDVDGKTRQLGAIIVNLSDYNVGANRGGEVTLFDNFDLNYNKQEYLIETRISGALIRPKSALAIEFAPANEAAPTYTQVSPSDEDSPKDEGWYEMSGNDYVLSEDETPVAGKTYYEKN